MEVIDAGGEGLCACGEKDDRDGEITDEDEEHQEPAREDSRLEKRNGDAFESCHPGGTGKARALLELLGDGHHDGGHVPLAVGEEAGNVAEEEDPEGAVDGGPDVDNEDPHSEHDTRETHGHGAQEVQHPGEPAPPPVNLKGEDNGQDHRDRGAGQGENEAVDDAVCRGLDGDGRPEEKKPLVIQDGEIVRYDLAHPYGVEAHHEDADDGQDDGDEDVEDIESERRPLPPAQIDEIWPEAFSGHSRELARRDDATLHPDENARDDAEDHAHGRAHVVVRLIAHGLGEDLGCQGFPAVGRAQLEGYAEFTRAGDEDDDGARKDTRRGERKGDGQGGVEQTRPGHSGAVLEGWVHAPQGAHHE